MTPSVGYLNSIGGLWGDMSAVNVNALPSAKPQQPVPQMDVNALPNAPGSAPPPPSPPPEAVSPEMIARVRSEAAPSPVAQGLASMPRPSPPPPPPPASAEAAQPQGQPAASSPAGEPSTPPFNEGVGVGVVRVPYVPSREMNVMPPTVQKQEMVNETNRAARAQQVFGDQQHQLVRDLEYREDALAEARAREAAAMQASQEHKEILARARQTVDKATQRVLMASHIDRERYQKNMNPVEKVTTALSMFLGGLFAPLGMRDQFMGYVEDMQDRDIAAQKLEFRMAKDAQEAAKTTYGSVIADLGDTQAADAVMKVATIERTKAEVERLVAEGKLVISEKEVADYLNRLDDQIMEYKTRAYQMTKPSGGGLQGYDKLTGLPLTNQQAAERSMQHIKQTGDRVLKHMDIEGERMKSQSATRPGTDKFTERVDLVTRQVNEKQVPQVKAALERYLAAGAIAPDMTEAAMQALSSATGIDPGKLRDIVRGKDANAREAFKASVRRDARSQLTKYKTGAAESDKEYAQNLALLDESSTNEATVQAVGRGMLESITRQEDAMVQAYGPEVYQEYKTRQRGGKRAAAQMAGQNSVDRAPAKQEDPWK